MSDDLEFAFLLEVHTAFKLPQTVLLGQYAQVEPLLGLLIQLLILLSLHALFSFVGHYSI